MRPEVSLTKLDLYRLRQKNEDKTHFGPELEQDDCPDCPKPGDGKQLELAAARSSRDEVGWERTPLVNFPREKCIRGMTIPSVASKVRA